MYNYENWETRGTIEDIQELEEAERMVIAADKAIEDKLNAKLARAQQIVDTMKHIQHERIKYRSYQRAADNYKKIAKKKGYAHKQKGMTRKDCAIVPADSLGWDKINLDVMNKKIHGVKVGYVFDVT